MSEAAVPGSLAAGRCRMKKERFGLRRCREGGSNLRPCIVHAAQAPVGTRALRRIPSYKPVGCFGPKVPSI